MLAWTTELTIEVGARQPTSQLQRLPAHFFPAEIWADPEDKGPAMRLPVLPGYKTSASSNRVPWTSFCPGAGLTASSLMSGNWYGPPAGIFATPSRAAVSCCFSSRRRGRTSSINSSCWKFTGSLCSYAIWAFRASSGSKAFIFSIFSCVKLARIPQIVLISRSFETAMTPGWLMKRNCCSRPNCTNTSGTFCALRRMLRTRAMAATQVQGQP
mmetsp:Transcript_78559/g.177428  ORF Transcript_78559/g.177428 Transcript_78559/m.177428 type:complete len:213 (-) Transcript_78559:58-696(-)